MEKVKVGFIGAGKHARIAHIHKMSLNPKVELVGFYDPNVEEVTNALKKDFGLSLKSFSDERKLLTECDAVVIASPDEFHFAQLELAVNWGIHTLVEKPICTTDKQCSQLKTLFNRADTKNVVISTCHPRRFAKVYQEAQDTNRFTDDLLSVEINLNKKPTADPASYGNSLLQDHLCHEFDALNYICGECDKTTIYNLVDSDYRYEVFGIRSDGVTFSFKVNATLENEYNESICLRFAKYETSITVLKDEYIFNRKHLDGKKTDSCFMTKKTTNEIYQELNDNFINTILGLEVNYITRKEMLQNASVIALKGKESIVL